MRFDATTSLDTGGAAASGVDPATATWAFKDGTPTATGAKVAHVFNQAGTFVGELRVRDRAGNLSDSRAFSVTVDARAGCGGDRRQRRLGGRRRLKIDRLKATARYVWSRHAGSIALPAPPPDPAPARGVPAEGGRPPVGQGGGPAPGRRAVRADGEAADAPRPRQVPDRVRRPGRDPADEPHAARAAGGRHRERAREPLRGPRRRPVPDAAPVGAYARRSPSRVQRSPQAGLGAGHGRRAETRSAHGGLVLSAGQLRAELRAGGTVVGSAMTRVR